MLLFEVRQQGKKEEMDYPEARTHRPQYISLPQCDLCDHHKYFAIPVWPEIFEYYHQNFKY